MARSLQSIGILSSILALAAGFLEAQTCDKFVGGYVPSWRNPAVVDYTKLSHTFYAFASTNSGGDLIVENVSTTFLAFKNASGTTQRYLSLGGAAGYQAFASMTTSETSIQAFANNCATFCQTHNLQGIDVDWEGIRSVNDSINYGKLMRALASALHGKGLSVVATVAYGNFGGDFYNVGALKKADWIQLMVYDQAGTWDQSPYGNHASYEHMLDAIDYWTMRGYADLSKIVIGLPFYGYRFNSTAGGRATALTYSQIFNSNPTMVCNQDQTGHIFFNGPGTIRKKTDYVIQHGLKGVMMWEMGQDLNSQHDRSLLRAVSNGVCDVPGACDPIMAAEFLETDQQIRLLSNPVRDVVGILLGAQKLNVASIVLMDVTGRSIWTKEDAFADDTEWINLSSFSSGFYFVAVSRRDQASTTFRIVKM